MNRKLWIWSGAVLAFVVVIIVILLLVNRTNEPTEEAESFCEAFPSAIFCQDEAYTDIEIAEDMLVTFMAHYPNVMSESFCVNYFSGNLQNYCLTDASQIVPPDFNNVSNEFEIVQISEYIFDVRTRYPNNVPAYTIRLALNDMDGAYHISGFSYYDTPAVVNLEMSDEEINTYMIEMIEANEENDNLFCDTYFTWQAKGICNLDEDAFITDPDIIYNYQIVEVATNRYVYTVTNENETETLLYDVLFEDVDGKTLISEMTITIPQSDAD